MDTDGLLPVCSQPFMTRLFYSAHYWPQHIELSQHVNVFLGDFLHWKTHLALKFREVHWRKLRFIQWTYVMTVCVVFGPFDSKLSVTKELDKKLPAWKAVFAWDWSSLWVARVVAICYGSNCQSWHVTRDSSVTPIIYLCFNPTFPLVTKKERKGIGKLNEKDEKRGTRW